MKPTLHPLFSSYPQTLEVIADILADADLNTALSAREHYFLLDGATLAQRVEVTR